MSLFEITTGYMGESFERCYVWAESKERAIEMFRAKFPNREPKLCDRLLSFDDAEFITKLDDSGFGDRLSR